MCSENFSPWRKPISRLAFPPPLTHTCTALPSSIHKWQGAAKRSNLSPTFTRCSNKRNEVGGGRESGEWREEIDNLPIGPGGAAEVDDETRPTDLTPPTRRQTAGIITSRQGKGRGPGIYSGTAMGAFWGRLGARQGEKARSTCLVIPPRSVVELQNLTLAAAFRWGMGNTRANTSVGRSSIGGVAFDCFGDHKQKNRVRPRDKD